MHTASSHLNGYSPTDTDSEPSEPRVFHVSHNVRTLRTLARNEERIARKIEREAAALRRALARLESARVRQEVAQSRVFAAQTEIDDKVGKRTLRER